MNDLDIESLRAETPGCATAAYFNHSGTSLLATATVDAITAHVRREMLQGGTDAAAAVMDRADAARADAAALLGASTKEIAFTPSRIGCLRHGLRGAAALRAGDRILVGRHEWGGNLSTLRAAADRAGATVETIPCREDGSVDPDVLASLVDGRVRLISLTWLPANGGLINDAAAVGRVARAAGIPYFIDAGQALGQVPVDVAALGCDMLKGAGRKFLRGPRGTALLYIRAEFADRIEPAYLDVLSGPWSDGPRRRRDARMFETSETSYALLLGLGAALRQARAIACRPSGPVSDIWRTSCEPGCRRPVGSRCGTSARSGRESSRSRWRERAHRMSARPSERRASSSCQRRCLYAARHDGPRVDRDRPGVCELFQHRGRNRPTRRLGRRDRGGLTASIRSRWPRSRPMS